MVTKIKIAVVGAGGVGGYFGGVLALAGYKVTLQDKGDHLAAMRAGGLTVETIDGRALCPSVVAIGPNESCAACDLVIVSVKGWELASVTDQIRNLSHEKSVILPLLNGIDCSETLQAALPDRIVVGGFCGINSTIKAPGVIKHIALKPFVTFGTATYGATTMPTVAPDVLGDIKSAFEAADVKTTVSQDIVLSIWQKFLLICPLSAVTSVARVTIDEVLANPETAELLNQCLQELTTVGLANEVALTDRDQTAVLEQIAGAPAGATTSMQRDIIASQPSELDTQLLSAISVARNCGVATPALSFIYSALIPQERAARRAAGI